MPEEQPGESSLEGTLLQESPMEEAPTEDVIAEAAPPPLSQALADLVRERSRVEAKLTPVSLLEIDGEPLDPEGQEGLIAEVLADEACRDLRLLRTTAGAAYLYSADLISDTYARMLLRLEENNPYETIVATVREESETYPRPTTVELFRHPPFSLDPRRVERLVEEMALLEQYRDVRAIRASTGALYLYSDRHIDEDWARSLVEWQEVGIKENP